MVEWDDVKTPPSWSSTSHVDEIGCWSVWAGIWRGSGTDGHHVTWTPNHWNLDVSYTPIPKSAKLYEGQEGDPHVRLSSLAALTYPDGRARAGLPAQAPEPAGGSGHTKLPDEHLACFDFLYYASEVQVCAFLAPFF